MSLRTYPAAPYAGLDPYCDDDAPFFFGRERLRDIIIDNLKAKRLTLVYGASGVGKSSVLRAGVEYRLRKQAQENLEETDSPEFAVAVFREWRDDPVAGLLKCVRESVAQTLGEALEPTPNSDSLGDSLHSLAELVGGDLFIILDQFEDYFLYCGQEQGVGAFSYEFPRLVNRTNLRVNFLISIRDDAHYKLALFRDRIPFIFNNALHIGHLDLESARAAIVGPIEQFNRFYATGGQRISPGPELVEEVLRQVRTGQVSLGEGGRGVVTSRIEPSIETPFLQLVMTELWKTEMRLNSAVLRRQTLDDLGGAQEIVQKHFRQAVGRLSQREKDLAYGAFKYLVTPSGHKIAHTASDLASLIDADKAELKFLLEKLSLGSNRILRAFAPPDREDEERYELFHEVLTSSVLSWCTQYKEDQRLREERQKSDDRLAEQKRRAEEERKLAEASARADEQAKIAWRLRLLNRTLALATAAAVIFAALALWQWMRAREATIRAVIAGNAHSDILAQLYQSVLYLGDPTRADSALRDTLATLNKERQKYRDEGVPIGEGITLNNIAGIYREVGRSASSSQDWENAQAYFKLALENYEEAQAILEATLGPDHPDVATSLHERAYVYMLIGKYAEAEPLFVRALSILEDNLGSDSRYVADAAVSLAHCYNRLGKISEAQRRYESAAQIRRKELGAVHPRLAESLNYLAWIYFEQGRYARAEPLFNEALAIWRAAPASQSSDAALSLYGLAAIYRERGGYKEAKEYLDQAQEAQKDALAQNDLLAAYADDNLAMLYAAQNDPQTEQVFVEAYRIRENGLGRDHPETASSATSLALSLIKRGDYVEAERYFKQARQVQNALPRSPELAKTICGLARLYAEQGKYPDAEPLFKQALAIQERAIPQHPDLAAALDAYAELLAKTDRNAAADEARNRAERIRQSHSKEESR